MRLAVVSGGGSGIGRASALRLAADGLTVIVVGRRLDALERTAAAAPAGTIIPCAADLATADGGEAVASRVAETGAALEGVVAAAGGRGPYGSSDDSLTEIARVWQTAFDINVLTAVLLVEALAPTLRKPGGAIVLFGSLGVWTPTGIGSYATANMISPGYVPDTEFFGEAGIPEAFHEQLVAQTTLGRSGRSDEIASLVSWLVSGNTFTTGQNISANGGAQLLR
jgi:3-oxoacyl-[acyl-carrier protein] reductase